MIYHDRGINVVVKNVAEVIENVLDVQNHMIEMFLLNDEMAMVYEFVLVLNYYFEYYLMKLIVND
jgi:hypothetical protein